MPAAARPRPGTLTPSLTTSKARSSPLPSRTRPSTLAAASRPSAARAATTLLLWMPAGPCHGLGSRRRRLVLALAVSGSTVYAGGQFSAVGGQTRDGIAALDASTGLATAWNPDASANGWRGSLKALAVSGSRVYAGGSFTSIGGQPRAHIAALDAGSPAPSRPGPPRRTTRSTLSPSRARTSTPRGWFRLDRQSDPQPLAALGGTAARLRAGTPMRSPSSAGPRSRSVGLDGLRWRWTSPPSTVRPPAHRHRCLRCDQRRRHDLGIPEVGGMSMPWPSRARPSRRRWQFTGRDGEPRNHIAAFDGDGLATTWDPTPAAHPTCSVAALAVSGSTVYAGGLFTSVNGQTRDHIAALSTSRGLATTWDPDVNGVPRLARPAARARPSMPAACSLPSTALRPVTTSPPSIPSNGRHRLGSRHGTAFHLQPTIAVSGPTVYAGGNFSTIGGQSRAVWRSACGQRVDERERRPTRTAPR